MPFTQTPSPPTAQDESRKQQRNIKAEEKRQAKEEAREEKKPKRLAKEMERERRHREEDRAKGYKGCLGEDPRSDIRATRRALGVSIRKRMPGTSWQ